MHIHEDTQNFEKIIDLLSRNLAKALGRIQLRVSNPSMLLSMKDNIENNSKQRVKVLCSPSS